MEKLKGSKSPSTTEALGVTFVVCLVLCLVFLWWSTRGPSPVDPSPIPSRVRTDTSSRWSGVRGLEWPALGVDVEAIMRERRARGTLESEQIDSEEVADLREIYRHANDHQFSTTPIPTIPESELRTRLDWAVNEVVAAIKPHMFVTLSKPILDDCAKGLVDIQEAIERGDLTLDGAQSDPDFNTFAGYRRNCGPMIEVMRTHGLMDERAKWVSEDAAVIGEVLQRYKWSSLIADQYPEFITNLTDTEILLFYRWRVERAVGFTGEQRRDFLEQLGRLDPSYPTQVAMILIEAESGETRRALELASRFSNQSPEREDYKRLKRALVDRLKTQTPQKGD